MNGAPDTTSVAAPKLAEALQRHQAGDIAGAIKAYREILTENPGDSSAASNLGVALRATGDNDGAITVFKRALTHAPDHLDLSYNYGNALRDLGDNGAAAEHYRRVLAMEPTYLGASLNLALVLIRLKRFDDAIAIGLAAIRHHPLTADLHMNLGVAYWHRNDLQPAIACYRRAAELAPTQDQILYNLGLALEALGDHAEAARVLEAAALLAPNKADTVSALGQSLVSLGQTATGLALFDRAKTLDPDHLDAHLGTARALLLEGRLDEAWADYDWHRKRHINEDPKLPGQRWDGNDPSGRTILVYAEQGFGDTIQFARYASLLADRGAKVILRCPKPLVRILRNLSGISDVIDHETPLPAYDAIVPIMDLPRLFSTSLATIPGTHPYLRTDQREARATTLYRIGIVWAGSARHQKDRLRSCRLDDLAPLFEIAGTSVISVQTGAPRAQIATSPYRDLIVDAGGHLSDFADTAGLLVGLDLLITVDTAIAHLAGALGLPVWTMLNSAPDWRWMLGRTETPWYPTMRLFRQTKPGDWASVATEIAQALRPHVARKLRVQSAG